MLCNRNLPCVLDTDKEKQGLGGDGDPSGGGSDMGPSAALTPAIWDKTIPYDGENFHLEYMDLEEFLMENGLPASPLEDSLKSGTEGVAGKVQASPSGPMPATKTPIGLLPIQELDKSEEEVVIITKSDADITSDVTAG